MEKTKNVFIKFQLEKDDHSGDLMLTLNFDKNAPNFSAEKDQILWTPTFEEINFFLETYDIINKKKTLVERCQDIKNTEPTPEPSYTEPEIPEVKVTTKEEVEKFDQVEPEPQLKEEEYTKETEKKEDDKKIFVQADEESFDQALKKRGVDVGEGLLLDQDDKNIIDKMLKKREKK